MNIYDKEIVKAYLLGRISDEETLAGIEEALFLDEDFTGEVELAEDEIINDYVFGNLSAEDREAAENCFFKSSERQFNLKLTQELREKAKNAKETQKAEKPSFFESLKSVFRQPAYAGALVVLVIAVIGFSVYFFRNKTASDLTELQALYAKERPVESRISEFSYAPASTTRGANENQENINKLRRIENNLIEAVEKNPSAENQHNLGVFYLTKRDFAGAVRELGKAFEADSKNAKIANDLGSAFFESARGGPDEKKKEILARALENFSRASELDANLLEAFFNKALCLQELQLSNEAREAWRKYLEKDSDSGWAGEARKNLQSLESLKTFSKTKEQVFNDFFDAYRSDDKESAWKIICQTKEMITGVWLPGQLTSTYLEARGEITEAPEYITALKFIGELEKTKNADFFVTDLAEFYSKANDSQIENLRAAKDLMRDGLQALKDNKNSEAAGLFEKAASVFSKNGDVPEEKIALLWAAQSKPREGKIEESLETLNALEKYSKQKNYKWLYGQAIYWISENFYLQNKFTKRIELCKDSLRLSKELGDTYAQQKSIGCLLDTFDKLGESSECLKYLAEMPDTRDLYYYGAKQARRDYVFTANLFNRLNMFRVAESFGRESLNLAREMPDKSDEINGSLELLAKIYVKENRFAEAMDLANESKTLAETKKEGRMKTFILAKATLQIADAKREMQRCEEALNDYDAAIEFYAKIDEIRLNDFAAHKGKLLCLQALKRDNDLPSELETVLSLSEKYRSEILKDDERQTFFDNEQIVYDAAIENSLTKTDSVKAFELAESSKARSLLDFVEKKTAKKLSPEVSKPLSLNEIQTRMPENVQIVQFAVLTGKTIVWILTKNEIKTIEINVSADDLEKKISAYLKLIIEKSDKTEIEKSSKELYAALVEPILPALDSTREICLLPDKALHQLPFAALESAGGKFLLEDLRIFYAPSASVFVLASEKAKELEKVKDERLLSVGNPAFDKDQNAGLAALPAAAEEARQIAELYSNAALFSGAEATKTNFLSHLENAEVVHFAGHYVAAETTRFSKLLFADGDLRLFEIAATRLPKAKLIVLSACRTGIEKFYRGEGAIGVARAFLAVGAPVVVASRWQIDSEAAKDLMIAFHRNRREKNLSVTEALRAAQIEMLRGADENFRQPYFWSAFSVIGANAGY
ncbi:MAG TPA: CHAT domain-containing protein [Pyrinomonadaceae bacterium]|jgi:CHAT domain-containing protein/cytochrome c-type biogenesis protein CcmH/NrfG